MENISPEMCLEALERVYHDSYSPFFISLDYIPRSLAYPFPLHIFVFSNMQILLSVVEGGENLSLVFIIYPDCGDGDQTVALTMSLCSLYLSTGTVVSWCPRMSV